MKKRLFPLLWTALIACTVAQTNGAPVPQEPSGDLLVEHADPPTYPPLARTAHIVGALMVQVTVKEGKVVTTKVKSGPPMLAAATIKNIQSWRFYQPVNAAFITKFVYQIEEKRPPDSPLEVELHLPFLVKITTPLAHQTTNY
jgi:outer membrane biosynthesis protein TonB